jgi:hypothetical protein
LIRRPSNCTFNTSITLSVCSGSVLRKKISFFFRLLNTSSRPV